MDLRILAKLITSNILPFSHLFVSFSLEIVKISIFELHFDVFRYDFQINISTMQTIIKDPDDSFVLTLRPISISKQQIRLPEQNAILLS